MNARIALPLATITVLLATMGQCQAAEGGATAALPDNEAQAKARAALITPEPAPVAPAADATATPAATTAPPANSSAQPVVLTAGPQPDNADQARARAMLYEGNPPQDTGTGTAITPTVTPVMSADLTAGMEAPALPITANQQLQLDQLLQQYRSDTISAAQYHARRAEILGNK